MREAREHAQRLLDLARSRGDRLHEGHGSLLLAYDDLMAGDLAAAEREYQRAAQLLEETGDLRVELMARTGLGRVLETRGDIDNARLCYMRVLEGSRKLGDPFSGAHALNNLGVLEFNYGDPSVAQGYYRKAFDLQVNHGNPEGSIVPATNLAIIHAYMGEYDEAVEVLNETQRLCEESGYHGHEAVVLEQMGTVRKEQGRLDEAAELFRRAAALASEISSEQLGRNLLGLAQTLALRDSVDAGIAVLKERFDRVRHLLPPEVVFNAERLRGELLLRSNRAAEALERFRQADRIGRTLGLGFRVHPLTYSARCHAIMGRADSARVYLDLAVEAWESERARMQDPVWREQLQIDGRLLYAELAHYSLSDTASASPGERARSTFDALQRFKARTLRERMLGAFAQRADSAAEEIPGPVTLAELQESWLSPDEVLLDVFLGTDGVYLFGVTRTECRASRIPHETMLLQRMLERYRDLVANRPDPIRSVEEAQLLEEASRNLSSLLLSPVADLLQAHSRIILALDGYLNMIPVEALPFPQVSGDRAAYRPLGEQRQIVRIPSATVLRDQRSRAARTSPVTPPARILVVLGEPDSAGSTLPGARGETAWLRRSFRKVRIKNAGNDQTTSGWNEDLAGCDIIHLASHVQVDDSHPWRSGLPQLRAHQIAGMRLPARLAVLAGCESAGGRVVSGEGVLGLTAAFTAANVPSLVVTLWPVSDRVTARLMRHFYCSLERGRSVGEALRSARQAIREDPRTSHPFYWAGFVLVGEEGIVVPIERIWTVKGLLFLLATLAAVIGGLGGVWWRRRRRSL
jgi:CHAT domain-containing protein/Flp pilus assembly protein TadD